jgi:hypothetical protein
MVGKAQKGVHWRAFYGCVTAFRFCYVYVMRSYQEQLSNGARKLAVSKDEFIKITS